MFQMPGLLRIFMNGDHPIIRNSHYSAANSPLRGVVAQKIKERSPDPKGPGDNHSFASGDKPARLSM